MGFHADVRLITFLSLNPCLVCMAPIWSSEMSLRGKFTQELLE
jgi:hypothetical protein